MMEERENWTEGFRHGLEGWSEPVPDDGWTRLEAALKARKLLLLRRRRRMAVAAAACIAAAVWMLWSFPSGPVETDGELPSSVPPAVVRRERPEVPTPAGLPTGTAVRVPAQRPIPSSLPLSEHTAASEEETASSSDAPAEEPSPSREPERRREAPRTPARSNRLLATVPDRPARSRWNVTLSVGGLLSSTSVTAPGYSSLPRPKAGTDNRQSDPLPGGSAASGTFLSGNTTESSEEAAQLHRILSGNAGREVISKTKHRLPFSLGLSVQHGLDERWAIETGLTYTCLTTDIRAGGEEYYYETTRRLHYIGIPLRASCLVARRGRLSLRLSAGGMAEKCVSGRASTVYIAEEERTPARESLHVGPLQWSVTTAIGLHYRLSEHVGIYAEPGAAYYFDDGSSLRTLRKEHPFQFTLQAGIRLTKLW